MMKTNLNLPLLIALALTFFGCSSDGGGEGGQTGSGEKYAYCVFMKLETCLSGPFTSCESGGSLNNECPFEVSGNGDSEGVTIGGQVWMKKNLNKPAAGSKCYEDLPANCETYGRLYDWATAKSICPSGWRLPDSTDFRNLHKYVESQKSCSSCAGKHLKAKNSWDNGGNGLNSYEFGLLAGGLGTGSNFRSKGEAGYLWTATGYASDTEYAITQDVYSDSDYAQLDTHRKTYYINVRCIKDGGITSSPSSSSKGSSSSMGGGGTGTVTITDIPATYNGKYLYVDTDEDYIGCESISLSPTTLTLVQISNGRASMPMWDRINGEWIRWNGSGEESLRVTVGISDAKTITEEPELMFSLPQTIFSNGSATISFSEAIPEISACEQSGEIQGDPITYQGEIYPTVVICGQTWFAKNLNYAVEGSKCYGEDGGVNAGYDSENKESIYEPLADEEIQANCDKYGRLYEWQAAKTACPIGWHLPTNADWDVLLHHVDGTRGISKPYYPYESSKAGGILKATSGWEGTSGNGDDTYGFAAMPGGIGYTGSETSKYGYNFIYQLPEHSYLWSASENILGSGVYYLTIYNFSKSIYWDSVGYKTEELMGVRCIMDN